METRTIIIATLTQFVILLGFSVVMPIGPDIARDLGLPVARLGLLASSYALSGFCAGLLSASLLDRLSRRAPLVLALGFFSLAMLNAAFASDLPMLMVIRMIAGACSGICTALLTAIIGDTITVERRGRAYAMVLGTGPLVSIIGIPIAIQVAAIAGWRTPLLLIGALALGLTMVARFALPAMTGHLGSRFTPAASMWKLVLNRAPYRTAMSGVFLMAFAFTLLTANNASLLLLNLELPRAWLSAFYMACGITTFLVLRMVGRAMDRRGPLMPIIYSTSTFCGGVTFSYVLPQGLVTGASAMFIMIMSISVLNVSILTLALGVPAHTERAGFGALLGALQNLAGAAGAGLASIILIDLPGPRLGNVDMVGLLAIGAVSMVPIMARQLKRQIGMAQRAASCPRAGTHDI